MVQESAVVLPHQLFRSHPALTKGCKVILYEHPRFFTDFRFHKQKLILHRASMKYYEGFLKKRGFRVKYVEFDEKNPLPESFACVDPVDSKLRKELEVPFLDSPMFLTPYDVLQDFFSKKKSQTAFYRMQRKRLGVLLEDGKPEGGKWTYDVKNREPYDPELQVPDVKRFEDEYIKEAKRYVKRHFPGNPGSADGFVWPVTHSQARARLKRFIKGKFEDFGPYEDAISKDEPFLFHSLLSSSLNIGLLTPREVLDAVLQADAPLPSKEGFVRQVIGWREFMRGVYEFEGESLRESNELKHDRKLPDSFYSGIGIVPVDTVISRVRTFAYCHHIERLMVLGNFMLLCEFRPKDVYRWFMELFIDAYDWVMVPNVFAMSQYSKGGVVTTKPYVSSSNYVRKMSDFPKGEWCEVWDSLFWRFIRKHKKRLKKNPRMALLVAQLDSRPESPAEEFLDAL